jgi:hypothetical protein
MPKASAKFKNVEVSHEHFLKLIDELGGNKADISRQLGHTTAQKLSDVQAGRVKLRKVLILALIGLKTKMKK